MKDDKPPTSKEEAAARPVRPPPEKYDPDTLSHWSITMMVAWIIWREIDAVRNEWDDYRDNCADWKFENDPIAPAQIGQIGPQKGSWHLREWPSSGWKRLYLRANSESILEPRQPAIRPPQVAIVELWQAAGEGRIKATALEYTNAKALLGDQIEIHAHYWPRLKPTDDPLTGKAMLTDDQGIRVYRDVQFPRLDVKELWPKSPPLSGEPLEHVENPEPDQTRPAEPESLESKASPTPTTASKRARPQAERAERYIKKNFPNGTDGITTAAIHNKLEADTDLQAELKKLGTWDVPSPTEINRVLGRRKA